MTPERREVIRARDVEDGPLNAKPGAQMVSALLNGTAGPTWHVEPCEAQLHRRELLAEVDRLNESFDAAMVMAADTGRREGAYAERQRGQAEVDRLRGQLDSVGDCLAGKGKTR